MRNSNLGNISIGIPTESRLRSFSDFDDKSIMVREQDEQSRDLNFNQNQHIGKWLACRERIKKKYVYQVDNDSTKNSNCYMIQIDDIIDVLYRKKNDPRQRQRNRKNTQQRQNTMQQDQNKAYIKIIANFVNTQTMNYSARTIQFNLVQLQEKSSSMYKVTNPRLTMFFHSKHSSQSHYKVRIQLSVVQSKIIDLQQVAEYEQYIGYCDIDPFKGLKNKQRVQVYSTRLNAHLDTCVLYTVLVSDSFKILEKLIPANCLCSCQEAVAGLAGRKLPNTLMGLNHSIQYTQLHSLKIDIYSVNIPDNLLHMKLKQCQQTLKHFQNVQSAVSTIKQVSINCKFHNGWTVFSETFAKIQDKMQIQKKSSKKANNQIVKIRHYTSEELLSIPFIFLDQQAILLFQIVAKVEVKCKTDFSHVQSIMLPICYAFYFINKVSVDEKQTKTLFSGDAMNANNDQFGSKKNETIGKIQFYINIQHANKMQLSKHLITIHSNKSHADVDKIILQKQRMIRQNRKLRHQNRIKKIQLNQEIPILDTTNFKQNLYKSQVQRLREQRRQKQQVLNYLRRKVKQLCPNHMNNIEQQQQEEVQGQLNKFAQKGGAKLFYDSVFYKAALQTRSSGNSMIVHNPDTVKLHIYPYLQSVNASIHQSGQVPLDIIKTQLLQKNYSYAIFINLISILPVSEETKLPRKFYFQTNFYKNQYLKSCICTINQSTGQIQVCQQAKIDNKQVNNENKFKRTTQRKQQRLQTKQQQAFKKQSKTKTQKIFYIEVNPSLKTKNSENSFIELISYLYHSELQIRFVDQVSSIQFGECFFKLRDVIRMRRNQVSIMRDLWVKRSGETKAKLKIEIKSMRKQAPYTDNEPPKPQLSQIQSLSMQPQARQLHRIAQFKKNKQNQAGGASLLKVQKVLNQQLIKQQIFINVSRMKGQFIKLDVTNRKNYSESYRALVNDPDKSYMSNQELVVVNGLLFNSIKETKWWKYINSIDQSRYNNIIITDDKNCFQLSPGQTGSILLYYYSQRKYEGNYQRDKQNKLYNITESMLRQNQQKNAKSQVGFNNERRQTNKNEDTNLIKVYNHRRCIDLTLSNSTNNFLSSIYKIHIVPQPDSPTIYYTLTRKSNTKIFLQIPYNPSNNHVLYIDDPTVISSLNESEGCASLDCYSGQEGECHIFNASVLSPYPENRLLLNYRIEIWGAREVYLEAGLWDIQDFLLDLHSSICLKNGLEYVIALSENERIIQIKDKNPIKVNQKQAKTMIKFTATACNIGINHYQLNIISPINYSIIYRYTIKLQTLEPQITQKITLRIKLTDKFLQQPFGFKNQLMRKQKFRILSTHPHILWCSQGSIDVDANSEKKVKVSINAEEISQTEAVVLSFLAEKSKLHYLFVLELDNQL